MKTILLLFLITILTDGVSPSTTPTAAPQGNACTTIIGQPRKPPCEFEILTVWFMGKNNEVLGKVTKPGTAIKLPGSKAISKQEVMNGGSLMYNVSIDFRRINTPSTATAAYTLSKANITNPISAGETQVVNDQIKVSPNLPQPGIRPNRILFNIALNYGKSQGDPNPQLIAPIQLLQLENPVTFAKLAKAKETNQFRDWAEAWMTFSVSVDFTK